jgi:hypothetical protein
MLNKSLCAILVPVNIRINYPTAQLIKAVYSSRGYRVECSWNRPTKTIKGVRAVFTNVVLSYAPKPFNEVQLAVELWVKDNAVTSGFYLFL